MRSVRSRATLKHNPRTETRDKRRGKLLIINRVSHYLPGSLSLSLYLSHTYMCTQRNTQLQTLSFPLSFSLYLYLTDRNIFYRWSSHLWGLPCSSAGQPVKMSVIRTDSASGLSRLVVFRCVYVGAFGFFWQSSRVAGKKTSAYLAQWAPPSI